MEARSWAWGPPGLRRAAPPAASLDNLEDGGGHLPGCAPPGLGQIPGATL